MYERILVPIDGSSTSTLGLREAARLAKGLKAKLRVIHVTDEFITDAAFGSTFYDKWIESIRDNGKAVMAAAEAFVRQHDMEPDVVLLETLGKRAADVIIDQAKQWPADLIVMGTHGRRGMHRLLMGSDAEMVLRSSPVPLLMVRQHIEVRTD